MRGIAVNEETLALAGIEEMGINAHPYDRPHTVAHFRDVDLLAPFFDSWMWGVNNTLDWERFKK